MGLESRYSIEDSPCVVAMLPRAAPFFPIIFIFPLRSSYEPSCEHSPWGSYPSLFATA